MLLVINMVSKPPDVTSLKPSICLFRLPVGFQIQMASQEINNGLTGLHIPYLGPRAREVATSPTHVVSRAFG